MFNCEYCDKTFKSIQGYYKHKREENVCHYKRKIAELEEENKNLQDKCNITNNITINNNTYNYEIINILFENPKEYMKYINGMPKIDVEDKKNNIANKVSKSKAEFNMKDFLLNSIDTGLAAEYGVCINKNTGEYLFKYGDEYGKLGEMEGLNKDIIILVEEVCKINQNDSEEEIRRLFSDKAMTDSHIKMARYLSDKKKGWKNVKEGTG